MKKDGDLILNWTPGRFNDQAAGNRLTRFWARCCFYIGCWFLARYENWTVRHGIFTPKSTKKSKKKK